ncbi:MAG: DUF374 domain-containing protein [Chloroherpetonaceae bacterium]|nr:DUF374 domain-containing protein [Chloroherpetonaceae bacterium]
MQSILSYIFLPALIWLLFKSLRFDKKNFTAFSDEISLSHKHKERGNLPIIFAFWHGKMLTGWLISKKINQKMGRKKGFAVVSLSKDGSMLAGALSALGFDLIRGSSSRGKEEMVHELKTALSEGHTVFITPDGPRGPREIYKYGSFRLASECKASVVFLKITHKNCWVLKKSWDQFEIPKPFSTVYVSIKQISDLEFSSEASLRLFTESFQNEIKSLP